MNLQASSADLAKNQDNTNLTTSIGRQRYNQHLQFSQLSLSVTKSASRSQKESNEMSTDSFLPYHEPSISIILIQSSFLLALNIVNTLFDKLIFCGLLAQVFIGVAWGTPGAKWLDLDVEDTVVQLGYLGLILL